MSEEAIRFRMRARQCRELAQVARDEFSRVTLSQMAAELDEEADQIEDRRAEQGARYNED